MWRSEGRVVVKTPWTLVKLFVALEADYYFCHHPHKMECKGQGQTGEGRFWDFL